jgi:hypothetical protein
VRAIKAKHGKANKNGAGGRGKVKRKKPHMGLQCRWSSNKAIKIGVGETVAKDTFLKAVSVAGAG